jgi:hypothetical protein
LVRLKGWGRALHAKRLHLKAASNNAKAAIFPSSKCTRLPKLSARLQFVVKEPGVVCFNRDPSASS